MSGGAINQLTTGFWRLVFHRERWLITGSLLLLLALSWVYLWHMAMMMPDPSSMGQTASESAPAGSMAINIQMQHWTALNFFYMLIMWIIMMVAMMIPSAAPTILAYDSIGKHSQQYAHSLAFTLGYLAVWSGFSLLATLLQWLMTEASLLSVFMAANSPLIAAVIMICAGIYQCSPLKQQCLIFCRSPFEFLTTHLKPGVRGGFYMGVDHGRYCLGCCWALMLLLFMGGVMNLIWIMLLTLFVLLEKVLPFAENSTYVSGGLLIFLGVMVGLFHLGF